MKTRSLNGLYTLSLFLRSGLLTALFLSGLILTSSLALAQEDDDDFFIFDEDEEEFEEVADPLESINRVMFAFNDSLYRGLLKPVAVGFRVVPEPARISVSNFFNNLTTPVSAINALLQFDLENAGTEIARFAVNSIIGILGLFDPATDLGLVRDDEDLGQTLGRYGVGHGFYLVVPFLGASSLRDIIGSVGNTAMDPIIGGLETREIIGVNLIRAETGLSLDKDTYEAFYDNALDPYIFFRSAYIQYRAGRVEQ